jgi:hypothetical protein
VSGSGVLFFGSLLLGVVGCGPLEEALFVCEITGGCGWYYRNVSVVRSRGPYLKWKDRLENRVYV